MKKWLFLLLLFPLTCVAQTYQYLGVEDGLSNRRVYYIKKTMLDICGSLRTRESTGTTAKSLNGIN